VSLCFGAGVVKYFCSGVEILVRNRAVEYQCRCREHIVPQLVQVVCPRLHHRGAQRQILCMVICSSHFVAIDMRQRPLSFLIKTSSPKRRVTRCWYSTESADAIGANQPRV